MKRNILITLLTLCLIPIVIFSDSWLIRLVALLVLLVLIYVGHTFILSQFMDSTTQHRKSSSEYLDDLKNQNIKLVDHMRHEFLNHFQVVTGYIQLQKLEKVTGYLQQVKVQSYHDSSLSRLGIPSLIHYLLHLRTQESLMNIDWEISKDLHTEALIIDQETFSEFVQVLIGEWLRHAATILQSSQLIVKFEATDLGLQFKCMFSGQYDESTLEYMVNHCAYFHRIDSTIQVIATEDDLQLVLDVIIPYRSE